MPWTNTGLTVARARLGGEELSSPPRGRRLAPGSADGKSQARNSIFESNPRRHHILTPGSSETFRVRYPQADCSDADGRCQTVCWAIGACNATGPGSQRSYPIVALRKNERSAISSVAGSRQHLLGVTEEIGEGFTAAIPHGSFLPQWDLGSIPEPVFTRSSRWTVRAPGPHSRLALTYRTHVCAVASAD
jgi:hypothetical protein